MVWIVRLAALLLVAVLVIRVEFGTAPKKDLYFRVAAEDGDAFAQAQLGQHYLGGPEGEDDLEMAIYWLERAAKQDEPQALYTLGAMRESGHGFRPDIKAAFSFYTRAALLNNGPAQEALARIHAVGLVGPVDNVTSHKWQILSQQHGRQMQPIDFKARFKLSESQIKLAEAEAKKISDNF